MMMMIIDNILSDNTIHESVSGNIITRISDHFPQFIILNKVNVDYITCSYAKHDFSKFDEKKFVDEFARQNIYLLQDNGLSVNSNFELFYENVSTCVNYHAPLRKMNKKEVKFCEKSWITPKIQKLMKYRDKLLKKLNRKFTLNIEYLYKKFRNRVVNEIRSSRVKYYNSYFTDH